MPDTATLEGWFSAPRMACYADAPDPAALYVWDARLSKALLKDISHVEVLLRNFMADRLAADCERATGAVVEKSLSDVFAQNGKSGAFYYSKNRRYNVNR